MALKAGRVGVNPSEVDSITGKLKSGASITVIDNLNSDSSTDALSAKQGKALKQLLDTKEDASKIGGLEFRDNEGTAQYRIGSSGTWQNFNSGADVPSIIETDADTCLVFMFKRSAPTNSYVLKMYNQYSGGSHSDEIGETALLEIDTNIYICIIKLKKSSSSRLIHFIITDNDVNVQLASLHKSSFVFAGSVVLNLGNISSELTISADLTQGCFGIN